jgi:hypothetical protein
VKKDDSKGKKGRGYNQILSLELTFFQAHLAEKADEKHKPTAGLCAESVKG